MIIRLSVHAKLVASSEMHWKWSIRWTTSSFSRTLKKRDLRGPAGSSMSRQQQSLKDLTLLKKWRKKRKTWRFVGNWQSSCHWSWNLTKSCIWSKLAQHSTLSLFTIVPRFRAWASSLLVSQLSSPSSSLVVSLSLPSCLSFLLLTLHLHPRIRA